MICYLLCFLISSTALLPCSEDKNVRVVVVRMPMFITAHNLLVYRNTYPYVPWRFLCRDHPRGASPSLPGPQGG